jgi:cell division protein FtsQ
MDRFKYNQPNTRERLAARRRKLASQRASQASPGPRRALHVWFASGRAFSLMLLIGSLAGLFYVARDPRFTIQQFTIAGAETLDAYEVAEIADVRGDSIWMVDTDKVVERLQANAYVEEAQAYVSLPDQITIVLQERRPDLRWRSGGETYVLDAEGRVLSLADTLPITNTLVIEDYSNMRFEPNDQVNPLALHLGRTLALRLPTEVGITPAKIGWDATNGIVVTTDDNRTIMFGRTDDFDDKFVILRTLIADGTPFTLLDLRPNLPFYRNDAPSQSVAAEP